MNALTFGMLLGLIFVAVYFSYGIGVERGKAIGTKITLTNTIKVDKQVVIDCALNDGYALVKLSDEAAKAARGRQW